MVLDQQERPNNARLRLVEQNLGRLLNKKIDLDNERYGIIYPQEISVKTEPNLRSETGFVLHEGTKVQIIESYKNNWLKIKLIDGNIGWISNNSIKEF